MHCVRKVTDDLFWVGANDHRLSLFENIHPIPRGVSYNSYLLLDEKTVLFDTIDWSCGRQLLENIQYLLKDRPLDYLIVNHMEPDHAASMEELIIRYPNIKIVSNQKAFSMMRQFGFTIENHIAEVKEGDCLSFGRHEVTFIMAPMVHWPEAMATFDKTNGVLFSADAFGTFGALDGKLFNDEMDFEKDYLDDARRYYSNIVGKFGTQTQKFLKKAQELSIEMICPLHGPVWRNNLSWFIEKYDLWSRYIPEKKGILILYASMYGNTENAAGVLAAQLVEKGIYDVKMYDVSKTNLSQLVSDTFQYSHIVLASSTYNMGIFPMMRDYLEDIKALNVQNRTFAIMENGTWANCAGTLMKKSLETMKDITILEDKVTIASSMNETSLAQMEALSAALAKDLQEK